MTHTLEAWLKPISTSPPCRLQAGTTLSPLPPAECLLWVATRSRPPCPQGLTLESPPHPQQGSRAPARSSVSKPLRPGKPPPAIPWAWWTRRSPTRASTRPSPPTSAWPWSASCSRSRRTTGRPGCRTSRPPPPRGLAGFRASPGATVAAGARVDLRCRRLCRLLPPARAASRHPGATTVLCPNSGGLSRARRTHSSGPLR